MAYTYKGTAFDKIETAKARISRNDNAEQTALSSYINSAEVLPSDTTQEENGTLLERTGDTLGDIVKNVFVGTQKAVEGIGDFGAATIGVIAGDLGNDKLKAETAKFIQQDLTNDFYSIVKEDLGVDTSFEKSFVNDLSETGQNIVRGVAQGVGQMAPMFATAGLGSSLGASATAMKAIQATNLVGLGLSAAGTGTEQALNDTTVDGGVDLDRAYLYGLAQGAMEVATEKLVGGVYNKALGGGLADNAIGKISSKLAKNAGFKKAIKFTIDSLGEGAEEVVSEAFSNTLKTIYTSKDGKVSWESPDIQDMVESGVIGTLTAATLGGANIAVRKASTTASIQDTMAEIEIENKKADNLSANGKLTAERAISIESNINNSLEYLSKRYQKANEKARSKLLEGNSSLLNYINEDGTIKKTALAEGATDIQTDKVSQTMSGSLISRKNEIANTLAVHSTTVATELDEVQTANAKKLSTLVNSIGKKSGVKLKFVIADKLSNANAFAKDDYMVISKDRLSSTKTLAEDFAHETTHFAEGSKEYGALISYMQNSLSTKKSTKEYTLTDGTKVTASSLWQQAVMEVYDNSTAGGRENGYNISQATFEKLLSGEIKGAEMTAEEELAYSEIFAKASEYVLGNEKAINDLVESNKSLAKKWLSKIKNAISIISATLKGDTETANTLKQLRKAEKLFEKALAVAGEKYLRGKAVNSIQQVSNINTQQVSKNEDTKYSVRDILKTEKKYSRDDIASILDETMFATEEITRDKLSKSGSVKGNKGKILDYIWSQIRTTNGAIDDIMVKQVVDHIIDRVWLVDAYAEDYAVYAQYIITQLKPFLHNVNTESIKSELGESYTPISSRWNNGGAKGNIGTFVDALKRANIQIKSTTEADQIIEIDDIYSQSKQLINETKKSASASMHEAFTKSELDSIRADIKEQIVKALELKGKPTEVARIIKHYDKVVKEQKQALREGALYNKELNRALDKAEQLKPNAIKKFKNGSVLEDKSFTKVIGNLGKLKYRSDIRKGASRKIFAQFADWYNINNKLLNGNIDASEATAKLAFEGESDYLHYTIITALENFKNNVDVKGYLTFNELKQANMILDAARFILKDYNRAFMNGKQVNAKETGASGSETAQKMSGMHKQGSWVNQAMRNFGYNSCDPRAVILAMSGYQENNPLSLLYNDIRDGETKSLINRINMLAPIDEFFKKNKSYKKRLSNDIIKVGNVELTIDKAISLYMLSKQSASIDGLKNGWGFYDKHKNWVSAGSLNDIDLVVFEKEFSKADRDFMKVVRKSLDLSGHFMYDTDKLVKGFSTVSLDSKYYFPIKRYSGDFAKSVDESYAQAIKNISIENLGVTKSRVTSSRRIAVLSVVDVIEKHARDIGRYSGLAVPLKAFQRIYNVNAGSNTNMVSIRNTISEKVWSGFPKYITNLLADIQGISGQHNLGDKVIDAFRSAFAKYQLGANIKVILSQAASYPTAFTYLSSGAMAKAFTRKVNFENFDKYCEWAKARNYEHGVVLAESITDKVGKATDFFTKPIQWTDRLTLGYIWNACQFEVEAKTGKKFGTVENMKEAGKMIEKIGRETQPNYTASERSGFQRSQSSLVKSFMMFTSVPMKQFSRLLEAFGKERALRYRKNTLKEKISNEELKSTHTATSKAITAVVMASVVYVLMGQLIKSLLAKDRKDDEYNDIGIVEDTFRDLMSTSVNMLPFVRDMYNAVVNGYDTENYMYSAVNDLFTSIRDIYEGGEKIVSGDAYDTKDWAKPLRGLVYSVCQLTGIPVRNMWNLVYGITKRVDPSSAYKMNSLFYNSYSTDLNKAIAKEDYNLAETIIGLMLEDDGMTSTSPKVNEKLRLLVEAGYTVLPKSVGDTIYHNGETYSLTAKQQQTFKGIYNEANDRVETLINSRAFNSLDEEVQAKSIKWIFDLYYEKAVFDVTGEDADSKNQLFAETMEVEKFAMAVSACKTLTADYSKDGTIVQNSRKTKVVALLNSLRLTRAEKTIILAYLGYSVGEQSAVIKAFVRRIGLTRTQQALLLEYANIN